MNPIPGTAQVSGASDRLTDAQGDQAILSRSISIGPSDATPLLALPAGFGIGQEAPFFTLVWVGVSGAAMTVTASSNVGIYQDLYTRRLPSGKSVIEIIDADAVVDAVIGETGTIQDELYTTTGFPQRFTQAGSSQTGDIEQWLDQSLTYYSGIDCNANLFCGLVDINQDVFPGAMSAFSPREGMLGWDYDTHVLNFYDGTSWQPMPPIAATTNLNINELTTGGATTINAVLNVNAAVICNSLPTSDPHVAGTLWNSGGTVKISAG